MEQAADVAAERGLRVQLTPVIPLILPDEIGLRDKTAEAARAVTARENKAGASTRYLVSRLSGQAGDKQLPTEVAQR